MRRKLYSQVKHRRQQHSCFESATRTLLTYRCHYRTVREWCFDRIFSTNKVLACFNGCLGFCRSIPNNKKNKNNKILLDISFARNKQKVKVKYIYGYILDLRIFKRETELLNFSLQRFRNSGS